MRKAKQEIGMVRRMVGLVWLLALAAACDSGFGGFVGVQPPGTNLVFTTQPSDVAAFAAISPLVQVAIQNANNQVVSNSNAVVTVTIVPGTGAPGAVLTGGTAQPASNGLVNFNNLRIDLPGTGYRLQASSPGFPVVISAPFNVTP
jgi:adhesin/invasin